MLLYFNPFLRKLETDILKSEYIELIDPILIKEFKKAINYITPEYWQEIAFLFKNNINYVYSIDEQMAFTIIATKMGIDFLSKDPEYSYNALIKSLYKIQEKVYYILILPEDSLLTIFKKIESFMKSANQEQLQFSKQSFKTLSILLDITKSNNDELINKTKEDLLVIDQNNNTTKQIIQDSLIYLSKLNLSNNFTRRRYHA